MLKGVNRKIIEVRDPDSRYFERAILFVRQGDWAAKEIDEQAERYLRTASEEMGRAGRRHPLPRCSRSASGFGGCWFRLRLWPGCSCWRQWCCSDRIKPQILCAKPPVDPRSAGGFLRCRRQTL